ncbi:MAG: DNA gyrase modulator, partial [Pseudomonadota bacterium]
MTYTALPFDPQQAVALLADAASGADDGDIYIQRSRSEGFTFDDGRLKSATYDNSQGFGLRIVAGEASGNAHAGELTLDAIGRAADTAKQAKRNYSGELDPCPTRLNSYAW